MSKSILALFLLIVVIFDGISTLPTGDSPKVKRQIVIGDGWDVRSNVRGNTRQLEVRRKPGYGNDNGYVSTGYRNDPIVRGTGGSITVGNGNTINGEEIPSGTYPINIGSGRTLSGKHCYALIC